MIKCKNLIKLIKLNQYNKKNKLINIITSHNLKQILFSCTRNLCINKKKSRLSLDSNSVARLYKLEIVSTKDKPNALKRDSIYNIDMLFWKKGFQTFIYIYYKSFDIHICSSRTGSFYALCVNCLQ